MENTDNKWVDFFRCFRRPLMIEPKSEEEIKFNKRLEEGYFKEANLIDLFYNHQFYYIDSILEGCKYVDDKDTFKTIIDFAKYQEKNPDASRLSNNKIYKYFDKAGFHPEFNMRNIKKNEYVDFMNGNIKVSCEYLLRRAIMIGSEKPEVYGTIIDELENYNNYKVKLAYCANRDYKNYLSDDNVRVRELARFLNKYDTDMKKADILTLAQIKFLEKKLNNNEIVVMDGLCNPHEKDGIFSTCYSFEDQTGSLIEKQWVHVNIDIMHEIIGTKYDAYILNNFIEKKKIEKKDGFNKLFIDFYIEYISSYEKSDSSNKVNNKK